MVKFYSFFIFIISISITGCATPTAPLSNDYTVASISINKDVSTPERLNYGGNSASFGLIGVLVAGDKKENEWKAHAKEHGIAISDIVYEAFNHEMSASNRFPIEDDAKTHMNLEILSYGLAVPNGLSKNLIPTLAVRTLITDQFDKVLWEHNEGYSILEKIAPPVSKIKLKENPALLKELWETAAKEVAKRTISKI